MKRLVLMVALVALTVAGAFAATSDSHQVTLVVSQIAALTMNNGNDITLTIDDGGGSLVGGSTPPAAVDSSQYLQYTLVNTSAVPQRRVQVSSSAGAPSGTALTVAASGVSGAAGAPQGVITVGTGAVDLIRDIGSCATGTGPSSGALLTYSFSVTAIDQLVVASTPLNVTYTIVDQ